MSRATQELTGAVLGPKNMDTLAELRSQERVVDIPQEVMTFVPDRPDELDTKWFTKCVQSALSGCWPRLGGCTNEMLRLCFDDMALFQMLFRAAEDFARARVPDAAMKAFMSATMTALQKPEVEACGALHFADLSPSVWPGSSGRRWNQPVETKQGCRTELYRQRGASKGTP